MGILSCSIQASEAKKPISILKSSIAYSPTSSGNGKICAISVLNAQNAVKSKGAAEKFLAELAVIQQRQQDAIALWLQGEPLPLATLGKNPSPIVFQSLGILEADKELLTELQPRAVDVEPLHQLRRTAQAIALLANSKREDLVKKSQALPRKISFDMSYRPRSSSKLSQKENNEINAKLSELQSMKDAQYGAIRELFNDEELKPIEQHDEPSKMVVYSGADLDQVLVLLNETFPKVVDNEYLCAIHENAKDIAALATKLIQSIKVKVV